MDAKSVVVTCPRFAKGTKGGIPQSIKRQNQIKRISIQFNNVSQITM